jgi:hypothetical protein
MADESSDVTEGLGRVASRWTAVAALGSFLLYLLGYLTLRFQLSTYGVATNLDLIDEKYLFAGCRFLVYLVSSVPNILILVLPLAAVGYVPYKLLPTSTRERLNRSVTHWTVKPIRLPLVGTILSLALIQFVSRKCFDFGNVLVRQQLPDEWISTVILSSDGMLSLYFSGLLAGALITAGIFLYVVRCGMAGTATTKLFVAVMGFLVTVEFLLLPVNYGVLISARQLPRVAELGGDEKLLDGEHAWIVWDSKDALIYFVIGSGDERTLITIPRKDTKIKITAYDDIYRVLFGEGRSSRPSSPR